MWVRVHMPRKYSNKLINTCVLQRDDGELLRGRHRQTNEHDEQINDHRVQPPRTDEGCEETTTIGTPDDELGDPEESAATRRVSVRLQRVRMSASD